MDEAERIRDRIVTGFAINRIPKKEREWFIKFAEDEYCDDRGFALKHLINFYTGNLSAGMEHLESAINELANEIETLKQQKKHDEEPKPRKGLDGKVMKR